MGSWNGTCGISNLPIMRGEEVYCVLLKKNVHSRIKGGGVTKTNNFYTPMSIPFIGTYDEQGAVTTSDYRGGYVFNQFQKILKDSSINKDRIDPKNIDELIYYIERGKMSDIGFMLIHKEIYSKMLCEVGSRTNYQGIKIRDSYEKELVELKQLAFDRKDDPMGMIFDMPPNIINRTLVGDLIFFKSLTIGKNCDVLDGDIIDFILFETSMDISRQHWILQSGAGSQDQEFHIPKLIAQFILEKEKQLHTEYKEENTDYEDVKDYIGKYSYL